jgi:hypothetical protein
MGLILHRGTTDGGGIFIEHERGGREKERLQRAVRMVE